MSDDQPRPLRAVFDVEGYEGEVIEGSGFEPKTPYLFSIDKEPEARWIMYGAAKGGGVWLSKKCPAELADAYKKHPDQFEIFVPKEVNGFQVLALEGRDAAKFRPYMSKNLNVAFVHVNSEGQKKLVFMQMGIPDQPAVNSAHPEFESPIVRLSRKFGYIPPEAKNKDGSRNKERFVISSWLHAGISIQAEVYFRKVATKDGGEKMVPEIDIDTIELVDATGKVEPQKTLADSGIDQEIKETVISLAEGCKNSAEVIRKVKKHLTDSGETELQGKYVEAISKMRESKEILA